MMKRIVSIMVCLSLISSGLCSVNAMETNEAIASEWDNGSNGISNTLDENMDGPHAYDPLSEIMEKQKEEEYRDSVEYAEKTIVFSVSDTRKKGATANYLSDSSPICKENKLSHVTQIFETKSDHVDGDKDCQSYDVYYQATTKNSDIWEIVDKLNARKDVLYAEPDYIWGNTAEETPYPATKEEMKNAWHLDDLNATEAWSDLSLDGKMPGQDVVVAVIDTGVDYTHNDLTGNMWKNTEEIAGNGIDDDGNGYADDVYGIDLIESDNDPMDDHGHGTHVAGIIAMTAGNGGGAGLAYGAKIMAIKAGQSNGNFASTDIAKAIQYARANGADVINMSFGGTGKSRLVEAALEDAFSSCVLVASAGNDGLPTTEAPPNFILKEDIYPAGYTYVLGVMASDTDNNLASFSNWDYNAQEGCEYEVIAPGVDIYSTLPSNKYAKWSGTSMAAPIVAASAAILRSKYQNKNKYSSRYILGQLASATEEKIVYKDKLDDVHYFSKINIMDAIYKQPKPDLGISEVYIFDNKDINDNNNGDGIVQAGETIDLGFAVRNQWGIASNVTVNVSSTSYGGVENPYVEILKNNISLNDIGTFASVNNGYIYENDALVSVNNPIRLKIKDSAPNDAKISLRIVVSAKNGIDGNDTNVYTSDCLYTFIVQKGVVLSGVIKEDMTLTNDKYWIIQDGLLIPEGVIVSVNPGTQIQFWSEDPNDPYANDSNVYIQVEGKLICNGEEDNPIQMFLGKGFEEKGILIQGKGITDEDFEKSYVELNYTQIINPYNHTTNLKGTNKFSATLIDHCDIIQNCPYGLKSLDTYDWLYYGHMAAYQMSNTKIESLYTANNCWWFSNAVQCEQVTSCLFDHCSVTYEINMKDSVVLLNASSTENTSYPNFHLNRNNIIQSSAILNNLLDYSTNSWMDISTGTGHETYDLSGNYWGTSNGDLVKKQVRDSDNDVSLNNLVQEPYLTLDSESISNIYPFVTEAFVTDINGKLLDSVNSSQTVQVHVKFNRDMSSEIQPMVTFGQAKPFTDYYVDGDWSSKREWVGTIKIEPWINMGIQYLRIKDAAAEDTWLTTGTDNGRFAFEITNTGVQSMTLQGKGGAGKNVLSWMQDDYETLAGYNLYRSESYDANRDISDQAFTKINKSVLSREEVNYEDVDVEQGKEYYYYFTVVDTEFNESPSSNVVKCIPLDGELPVISHTAAASVTKGSSAKIRAAVTDNCQVSDVYLYYKMKDSNEWQSVEMANTTRDNYQATIASYEMSVGIMQYYIVASDGINNAYCGTENMPYEFAVTKIIPVLSDVKIDSPEIIYTSTDYSMVKMSGIAKNGTVTVDGVFSLDEVMFGTDKTEYTYTFTPTDIINYQKVTGTISLSVIKNDLEAISAGTTAPDKTSYFYGDDFDAAGLIVTAIFKDGTTLDVTDQITASALTTIGTDITVRIACTIDGITKTTDIPGITVTKKQIDISKVAWDTSNISFTYDGNAKGIVLNGDIPDGITVEKINDTATIPGEYTAIAIFSLANGYSTDFYEIIGAIDNKISADWSISNAEIPADAPKASISVENTVKEVSNDILGADSNWAFAQDKIGLAVPAGKSVKVMATYGGADADYYNITTKEVTITRAVCPELSYQLTVTDPTCTEPGYTTYTCGVCGDSYIDNYIDALDHSFGDWETVMSPSCTDIGSRKRICSVCSYTETSGVDAKDHDWETEYCTDREPTCTAEGSRSIHCRNCEVIKDSTVIPAAGHSFGDWKEIKSPNCTESGSSQRTCTVCEYTETKGEDAKGHDWEIEYRIDREPTGTSEGSRSIHCRNCKVIKDSIVIPATGKEGQLIVTENNNTVKVKLKSVKAAGKRKLKISWKSSGQNGFQIQCATNRKFTKNKKTANSSANAANKTMKGLKSKKVYYVRIRSYKIVSGKKYYGAWSNVKRCKVK